MSNTDKKGKDREQRTPIPKQISGNVSWVFIVISLLFKWFVVTAVLLAVKGLQTRKKRRLDLYKRCVNIIGDRDAVSIEKLAQILGKPRSAVINVLEEMISKNYLGPEAYIDNSADMLYIRRPAVEDEPKRKAHPDFDFSGLSANLSDIFAGITGIAGEVAHALKKEFGGGSSKDRDNASQGHGYAPSGARPQPEPEPQPEPQPQPEPEPQPAASGDDAGQSDSEASLSRLRELNAQILDEDVSRKIERIERLTGDIYAFVQTNPGRENEVRKFMNYYLPTTMKLLTSYALLERQSYQGDNIIAARHDIEKILDTLVHAFERQLDQLFATDAVDISSDIQVLETMMASDGLSPDKKGYQLKL